MTPAQSEGGPISGLLNSVRNMLATLIGIAQTRLELLSTEMKEEVGQVAQMLLWAFIAMSAASMGLFIAALSIIFAFWDTHRVLAAVLVMVFFFLLAAIAVAVLLGKLKRRQRLFHATIAEFAKDREHLKARI